MADEIKSLRETVVSLAKKVDELSGLSKQVSELTDGMKVMRGVAKDGTRLEQEG